VSRDDDVVVGEI
jgi:hypothetical protein